MTQNIKNNLSTLNPPTDLMTINELVLKHGFTYQYLYKWSHVANGISLYNRGVLKLSEREVLEFSANQLRKGTRNG